MLEIDYSNRVLYIYIYIYIFFLSNSQFLDKS